MEETRLFADLGLLLLAALLGGVLAQILRQPLLVGYLIGGILVGPFTPGPTISDPRSFQLFAEVGVVLLMFSTGIEFSISQLLQVRNVALYGAPIGIAMIVFLLLPVGKLLGWPLAQTLVVGAALSVASTMVILKFLLDRGELTSTHGRVIVGITLLEDLAVVAFTVLLPALAPGGESRLDVFGRAMLRAVLILAPLLWAARRIMPRLFVTIARTRNMELFLLVAVAVAIGTAALTASLGLSLALGAFMAGLIISESEVAHEALGRLLPMRDIFVAMFFVSVGTLVSPAAIVAEFPTVLALVAVVTLGKFGVWSAVVRVAGYTRQTAMLAGLGLTQIGEFSYILGGAGRTHGIVTDSVFNAILATSLVTIIINALVFRRMPAWVQRFIGRPVPQGADAAPAVPQEGHVLLCGFGRVGHEMADALDAFGTPYVVVDLDPDATRRARMRGANAVFGDAGSEQALGRAGAERARLAVVVIPDFEAAYRCVRTLRLIRGDLPILVRVHQRRHEALMLAAGATEVIQPEVEAGLTLVRHSLDHIGVDRAAGRRYLARIRSHWPGTVQGELTPESLQMQDLVVRNVEIAGRSLRWLRVRERTGATVVSIVRTTGEEILNPGPDETLHAGDRLLAIGNLDQLQAMHHLFQADLEPDGPEG